MTPEKEKRKQLIANCGMPKRMLSVSEGASTVANLSEWKKYMRHELSNDASSKTRDCVFVGDEMLDTARVATLICLSSGNGFAAARAINFWDLIMMRSDGLDDFYNNLASPLLLIEGFPVSDGGWRDAFRERKLFYIIEALLRRRNDDRTPTFIQTDGKIGGNFLKWWSKPFLSHVSENSRHFTY